MMAPPREFEGPVRTSEQRTPGRDAGQERRPWRMLLARDASSTTCDGLVSSLEDAFDDLEIVDASSVDDARASLSRARFDACLICLDLPPAPIAGVRLAQAALREVADER